MNQPWNADVWAAVLRGQRNLKRVNGLSAKSFRVLDNGVEQSINYFSETDFDASYRCCDFSPTVRGTWVTFLEGRWQSVMPVSFYLMGFAPSPLSPGECRKLKVKLHGGFIVLERDRYCDLKDPGFSEAMQDGTPLRGQMRAFAASTLPGSINVSVHTFVFRSSGVVQLGRGSLPQGTEGATEPAYKFVVQVHDAKAPATIQIATEFTAPKLKRKYQMHKLWGLPLYVMGTVYTSRGEIVKEFGDTYEEYPLIGDDDCDCEYWWIPRLYDTQVELPPGDYRLRVVVSDGKNFGTAEVPIQVERFGADRLSMSDLVVTDVFREASQVLIDVARNNSTALMPAPLISNDVQFFPTFLHASPTSLRSVPSTRRLPWALGAAETGSFSSHRDVSLYFEVYEPLLDNQETAVYFELRVTDRNTGLMKVNTGPMSAAKWVHTGTTVVPIAVELGMRMLPKGSYRLEVRASDSAGRQTAWKAAEFIIK